MHCATISRYSDRRCPIGRGVSLSWSSVGMYRTDLVSGTTSYDGSCQSRTSCRAAGS